MNMKKENARLCWDGSNKDAAEDWAMNDDVDMEDEPLITFGNTKLQFMKHLYNLRISYPTEEIWLGTADIKACFRWPKLHPDITGAFGFVMGFLNSFFLMTAMVFGFRASANSWEPFRRAIEALTAVFFVKFEEDISTVVRTLMRLIIGPLWLFRLPAKLIKRRSEMGGSQDKDT
jgi:hypothetical protein